MLHEPSSSLPIVQSPGWRRGEDGAGVNLTANHTAGASWGIIGLMVDNADEPLPVQDPTDAERRLWSAFPRGQVVDLRTGAPDVATIPGKLKQCGVCAARW